MSDVRTRAQEALALRGTGSEKSKAMADAVRDLLVENTQLETENERLISIEFAHAGCDFLRRKDNEYLIGRAEAVEAKITAALKAMDDGRLYGPARRILSGEDS